MNSICLACRHASKLRRLNTQLPFHQRKVTQGSRLFKVSEEIQQALHEKRPIVALESTIYTHGIPYPDNLALASRLESVVRVNGGVPATIGILEGVAHVGLAADELMRLASSGVSSESSKPLKVSRRDLGFALGLRDAQGKAFNGGTTVSGTMILAHMAGIKVFATGGLGGVHRGAEETMDVSADLTELGRTPVAVISSGCKSFLDIPKTLEYLETQGVAVATFADGREGQVDFPAFYSRDSGCVSPKVLRNEIEAASVIHSHGLMGLQSGLHFANPIPVQHEIPFAEMEVAIEQAISEAKTAGATGAASTPYILSKIKDLTGSKSLVANKALVEANVVRGTKVAKALRALEAEYDHGTKQVEPSQHIVGPGAVNYTSSGVSQSVSANVEPSKITIAASVTPSISAEPLQQQQETKQPNVFVAGILAVDFACDYEPRTGAETTPIELHTSNPARIAQSLGGVGHNVARAAHLMGADVRFCSAVGDDLSGKAALEALAAEGLGDSGVKTLPASSGRRTAQYVAVNDKQKDLVVAMADMSILHAGKKGEQDPITSAFDESWLPQLQASRPTHLALDANWSPQYLARWLQAGKDLNAHVSFEPVSNAKAVGIFQLPPASSRHSQNSTLSTLPKPSINLATPNTYELAAMCNAARELGFFDTPEWWAVIDALGIPSTGARVQMALATSSELVDLGIPQQSVQLLPFIPCICTKLGAKGVLVTQILPAGDPRLQSGDYAPHILSRCVNGTEQELGVGGVYMRLFPPVEEVTAEEIVSVNGVGDTFAGTLVAGLASRGKEAKVEELIDIAQRAAVLTLRSSEAVSPGLGTLRMLL